MGVSPGTSDFPPDVDVGARIITIEYSTQCIYYQGIAQRCSVLYFLLLSTSRITHCHCSSMLPNLFAPTELLSNYCYTYTVKRF